MRVSGESLVLPATFSRYLCFDRVIPRSLIARSTYLANDPTCVVYKENVDYTVDYENGTIARTQDSRIPDYSTNALFGQRDFDHTKFPTCTNHPFFVWVDYETMNGQAFAQPNDQSRFLKQTRSKLEAGGPFRIVTYGDSITAGGEASQKDFQFTMRYATYLQLLYPKAQIEIQDVSIPGYTSREAIERWGSHLGKTAPDLVLLGWGMNDHNRPEVGGITPEQFRENLIKLVGMIRDQKHADVVLFSSCPPHGDWFFGTRRMHIFAEVTRQAAIETNCAYANVYETWAKVLQRKDQSSLLGNNINHPNDFGHWLYEQAFKQVAF